MSASPRVIVGVGDTSKGLHPLVWAIAEARRSGAELHAIRTWRDRSSTVLGTDGIYRPMLQAAAAAELYAAFDGAAGGLPADVPVALVIEEGFPADVLTAYANRDDDLLVLGRDYRRWWQFGGGITQRCVRKAKCPITAVPPSVLARPMRKLLRELRKDISDLEGARQ